MASDTESKIKEKLAALRAVYLDPDFQKRVTDTENALRRNIARKNLAKDETVQEIIAAGEKAIQDISWLLANDEDIKEDQRLALFAEKRVHQFYLERLDGTRAQHALEVIQESVDSIAKGKGAGV